MICCRPLHAIEKLDLTNGQRHVWSAALCGFVSDLVTLSTSGLSEQAVVELPVAILNGLHGSWAEA